MITLLSCTREVNPIIDAYQQKLVINAELQPDKPIYLFVSTSVGLTSEKTPFHPTESGHFDAEIIVDGNKEETESITYFEKEEEDGGDLTWRTRRSFRPVAGQTFVLNANLLIDDQIVPVTSETEIPLPAEMDCAFKTKESNSSVSAIGQYRVQIDITPENSEGTNYYHLMAKKGDEYLDLSHFDSGSNAIERPYHHFGVLVDGSKLAEPTLNFLVQSNEEVPSFELQLRTCNKSYFDYHVALSRSYAAQSSPYNEPTINFTNINNGLGIFTAYSTTNQMVIVE